MLWCESVVEESQRVNGEKSRKEGRGMGPA
jgi:hypothetical protein